MFRRLAEAKRILAYRGDDGTGSTVEVRTATEINPSRISDRIASIAEGLVFCFAGGAIANLFESAVPHKPHAHIIPLIGVLTGSLVFILNQHLHRAVLAVQQRLGIGKHLSPFVGHRLEHAYRVLKS